MAGLSLASQPYELVVHLPYILVWAAATAGVLRGGAMARPAALLGTGLGAVSAGFFFEDLTAVIAYRFGTAGPGLALSLLGWAACTAGSVFGLTIQVRPGDGVPRRAIEPLGVLIAAAAIGTAVTLVPAWTSYTLVRDGSSRVITQGNDFAGPWTIVTGTAAVMVALVAVAVIAALRRPVGNGAVMLAGAIVPMIAQPISAVIVNSEPTSPVFLGISSQQASGMTITAGETPDFWIYCVLLILLIVSCAGMLTKLVRQAAAPV